MQYPVVMVLSGPEKTRAKAELALEKARLTVIPPKEWPIQRQSYQAEHWPHLAPIKLAYDPIKDEHVLPDQPEHDVPDGYLDDLEHGFLAVLAESEAAFHAAYGVVEKAAWVLRSHYELPEKPKPDPVSVLFDDLTRRLDNQQQTIALLSQKLGLPAPIGGAGFETGAGEFMQLGSYSAPQLRRSVFWGAARTSANVPGTIVGGLLSATDMQLSAAGSGLVVNTSVGECLIPGTEATSQGGYHAFLSSQNSTTLATANASNPRIDLLCATSADPSYTIPSGGTSGFVTIQAVTGTPTSGATLSNLSGAPTLPLSSLLLGYVLVPAGAGSLTGANIANKATTIGLLPGRAAPYMMTGVGANTSVPSGINTALPFGSAISSGYGMTLSSGGFAISLPGVYVVSGVASFNTASSGYGKLLLAKNGGVQEAATIALASGYNAQVGATLITLCAAGDGIAAQLYQNSGSTMSTCVSLHAEICYLGNA